MAGKQGEVAGEGVWRNAMRNLHGAHLHGAADEAAARDAQRAQVRDCCSLVAAALAKK